LCEFVAQVNRQPLVSLSVSLKKSSNADVLTPSGTNGQQKIIESLRKRAKNLRKVLNKYNKKAKSFARLNPEHPHPRQIEYADLMNLDAEDPFWNDGLFTNENEPWAVDSNTQNGIRYLAAMNRGTEEKRRLGWEVRRAMRWAIERHDSLRGCLIQLPLVQITKEREHFLAITL
jgi:hypothetical protein